MAKLTNEELLSAFKEMTIIELSEFVRNSKRPLTLPLLLLQLQARLPVAKPLLKSRPNST